jgi:hypothetical protein
VVNPTSKTDTLLVASAGGTSLVSAVEAVTTAVEANVHRSVQVVDVVPLQKGDGHGLTGFYPSTSTVDSGPKMSCRSPRNVIVVRDL